jgi:hypothetical protein
MDSPHLLKKDILQNKWSRIYVHSEHKEQKTFVGLGSSVVMHACMHAAIDDSSTAHNLDVCLIHVNGKKGPHFCFSHSSVAVAASLSLSLDPFLSLSLHMKCRKFSQDKIEKNLGIVRFVQYRVDI